MADEKQINDVLSSLSYGMYIVGAKEEKRPVGCVVNTVFQITSQNPIVALSIHRNNYTYEVIQKTGKFSICVLSEKTPQTLIGTFGFHSSKDTDKYEGCDYMWQEDLPVLTDSICSYILCDMVSMHMTDTHMVLLGRVIKAEFLDRSLPPMSYRYYHEVIKGKASKNAPTYRGKRDEETKSRKEEKPVGEKVRYVCTVCGYVYEGDITQEPDDYICPVCGVGKDLFEKMDD